MVYYKKKIRNYRFNNSIGSWWPWSYNYQSLCQIYCVYSNVFAIKVRFYQIGPMYSYKKGSFIISGVAWLCCLLCDLTKEYIKINEVPHYRWTISDDFRNGHKWYTLKMITVLFAGITVVWLLQKISYTMKLNQYFTTTIKKILILKWKIQKSGNKSIIQSCFIS